MPGGIHPPLEVILSWPVPNYDNPVTRPRTMPILAGLLGFSTMVLLFARLWVRIKMQHNAGLDDWIMVAAMPFVVIVTVLMTIATEVYGFNKHVWDIRPEIFMVQRKFILAIEVIFSFESGLIKVSILLFYRRLAARVVSRTFRWATWISIAFITTSSLAFTIAPLLGCRPLSAFWEQQDIARVLSGEKFNCFNEGADVVTAGIISAVQDLLTTSLPVILYWNLRIPIRQKIALFGIFAIGYLLVAVAAVRAYYSWYIFERTYDVTWYVWTTWVTVMLELHIGCMCANAPALKVFCKEYLRIDKISSKARSILSSKGSRSQSSSNGHSSISCATAMCCGMSSQKDGYLAGPHADFSVDQHGGIVQQKDIYVTNSPISMYDSVHLNDNKHTDDIEMGPVPSPDQTALVRMASEHHLDVQALPPFPPPSSRRYSLPRAASPSVWNTHGIAPMPNKRHPPWKTWS